MSNTFKGTPGPWALNVEQQHYNGNKAYEINYGNYGECVAEIVHVKADAVLISLAPAMLEMLQELVAEISAEMYPTEMQSQLLEKAQSLITRATTI